MYWYIFHLPRKPIDLDNILSLYGVREKYLNNLVSGFDEKLIEKLLLVTFYSLQSHSPTCYLVQHTAYVLANYTPLVHFLLQLLQGAMGSGCVP